MTWGVLLIGLGKIAFRQYNVGSNPARLTNLILTKTKMLMNERNTTGIDSGLLTLII